MSLVWSRSNLIEQFDDGVDRVGCYLLGGHDLGSLSESGLSEQPGNGGFHRGRGGALRAQVQAHTERGDRAATMGLSSVAPATTTGTPYPIASWVAPYPPLVSKTSPFGSI